MDGRTVVPTGGPGIVQWLPVGAGLHRLEGRYRAPAVLPAAMVSLAAAAVAVLGLALGARRGVRVHVQ